jgi:hypothetical protein
MAKRDPLKAKQRKQKIIAGVLGAFLLAALGVSVPFTLKMMKGGANYDTNAVSTTATPTTTPAVPAATTPTGTAELADTSTAVASPGLGQLVSFDRFQSKDPFVQQVRPSVGAETSGSTSPTSVPKTPVAASPAPTPSAPTTKPAPAPAPTTAVISVNGEPADVLTPGTDFPIANPLFTLVALTREGAKIAVAGGSYQSGAPAVLLKRGKKLTLVNTADGTRYELTLLWLGAGGVPPEIAAKTGQAQSAGTTTTSTAPTTTTPSAP